MFSIINKATRNKRSCFNKLRIIIYLISFHTSFNNSNYNTNTFRFIINKNLWLFNASPQPMPSITQSHWGRSYTTIAQGTCRQPTTAEQSARAVCTLGARNIYMCVWICLFVSIFHFIIIMQCFRQLHAPLLQRRRTEKSAPHARTGYKRLGPNLEPKWLRNRVYAYICVYIRIACGFIRFYTV